MNRDDQNRLDDILEFATRLERYVAKGYEEFDLNGSRNFDCKEIEWRGEMAR